MAKQTIHLAKLGTQPSVTVKGTKHGLLFLLDEQCPFEELEEGLSELLQGAKSHLFSGPNVAVFVDYGSRELTASQTRSLLGIFSNQENFLIREWSPRTAERQFLFANGNAGPAEQAFYKGTIRAGQVLNFEGDVVVLGDVNPGGYISATGDIYIFGRLHGIAHAGSKGDWLSIIAAIDFAPMQLRIADYVGFTPEQDGKPLKSQLEFAYIKDSAMAVDKLQFLSSFLQYRSESGQRV